MIDDHLMFSDHVASESRSCCSALFNIRLFLTQLLLLFCIYCNVLLMVHPCVLKNSLVCSSTNQKHRPSADGALASCRCPHYSTHERSATAIQTILISSSLKDWNDLQSSIRSGTNLSPFKKLWKTQFFFYLSPPLSCIHPSSLPVHSSAPVVARCPGSR